MRRYPQGTGAGEPNPPSPQLAATACCSMGANCCKPEPDEATEVGVAVKTWKRPKWKSEEPMTEEQLQVG